MRGTARTVFVALVAAGAAVTAAPAFAAEEPQLVFWKSEVRWGGATSMKAGPCTTYGEVTSPGFTAPVVLDSRGEGWAGVVKAEGTYTATVQCDDQVLSATFKVLPPAPPVWYISPKEVEPYGVMGIGTDALNSCPGDVDGPVTSPGFIEPVTMLNAEHGRRYGYARAIDVPGTYTATMRCKATPIPGEITFTILGTPPTSTSTTTPPVTTSPGATSSSAPPPAAAPRAPIVKPKGAPQTGGGATS